MARSTKARKPGRTENKNPSTTKAGPGRFHLQGHKKAPPKSSPMQQMIDRVTE